MIFLSQMTKGKPKKNRSASSQKYSKMKKNQRNRYKPNYYPINHANRKEERETDYEELRQIISEEFGVPTDCRLYFLKKHDIKNLPDRPRIRITFGNSVILDADTWEVIQVIRFHPFADMPTEKLDEFNFTVQNIYNHTLARSEVLICGSVKGIEDWGEMRSAGFRAGFDKGRTFGVTAFSATTGRNEHAIFEDQDRMLEMASINEILAESMADLCLHAYQSNRALAIKYSVPSFADPTWAESPNANVVGSSIVCTRDGFNNNPHRDHDASAYAYGLFARINRLTGELHWVSKSDYLGDVEGCRFIIDEYHVEVLLDACDGVVETIWALGWMPIHPRDSPITRFGCSLQINKSLVGRIDTLLKLKEGKSDAEWQEFKKKVVKCYEQEVDVKLDKIHNPSQHYKSKSAKR
ncbi:uncharacterized protein MELLADRAFT_90014 [Melampsora larici-populina 98AG31]|uniref:Tet-like 2OG-Fe(II) oxygenase domain-containing protein n=1 Tax=Melampsora larici-populina (strain 98AG31 / pathotype 3-4-7) TaxID=747676 RepID=F4RVF2_MELLP|nr:uncharacterized protein MELLADRAFT_90014 [Melampsora larici-populina 98AG31]EGG03614.1 hypothetical protein MELLADRAFT_90014 [Melampsora larici-populina 98AG31]